MTTTNKTHGLFYSLLRQHHSYDAKYKDMMKEELVSSYSDGKTRSLSEMYKKYPREYSQMIYALKRDCGRRPQDVRVNVTKEADAWRKRVIAAICGWMDATGVVGCRDKVGYAKSLACRAASCSDFNKIPEVRLQEIYNAFLKKQSVHYKRVAIEMERLQTEADKIVKEFTWNNNARKIVN